MLYYGITRLWSFKSWDTKLVGGELDVPRLRGLWGPGSAAGVPRPAGIPGAYLGPRSPSGSKVRPHNDCNLVCSVQCKVPYQSVQQPKENQWVGYMFDQERFSIATSQNKVLSGSFWPRAHPAFSPQHPPRPTEIPQDPSRITKEHLMTSQMTPKTPKGPPKTALPKPLKTSERHTFL